MTSPWVELRVHGVSGTPPEDLLNRPHVRQVDGDDRSRFFRSVDAAGHELPGADGQVLEGFHWGQHTAGSTIKALWFLLLPFGLVNVAAFMLPPPQTAAGLRARWLALASLRTIGVLLTMLFSLAASMTLVDLVGSQWLGEHTGRELAEWGPVLGMLATTVLLVFVLGGRSLLGGMFAFATGRGHEFSPSNEGSTPFAGPAFFAGDPHAWTLRSLHASCGLLVPVWVLVREYDHPTREMVILGLTGLGLAATFLNGDTEDAAATATRRHPFWRGVTMTGSLLLFAAACAFTVLATIEAHGSSYRATTHDAGATALVLVCGGAMTVLVLSVLVLARSTRPRRNDGAALHSPPFAGRSAAAAVAGLGLFLGVSFSAAVVVGLTTVLRVDSASVVLRRVAYAFALGVGPVVVVGLGFALAWLVTRRDRRSLATEAHPAVAGQQGADVVRWQSALANAWWFARLKNHVAWIVWPIVTSALALTVPLVLEQHWDYDLGFASGKGGGDSDVVVQAGTWLLLAIGTGAFALMRGAFRDSNARRTLNIVWDVVAFWPHAAHPFVPQPYSRRVVPDLVSRIRFHLDGAPRDTRQVVIAAHSQGSLITFAALKRLSFDELQRVGLVTFGSQLRVIFPRAFPAYINIEEVAELFVRSGGAWVNLYRETDPLAGPVLSWDHADRAQGGRARNVLSPDASVEGTPAPSSVHGTVCFGPDWRLLDPVPHKHELDPAPVNKVWGHGGYWTHPDWDEAIRVTRGAGSPST